MKYCILYCIVHSSLVVLVSCLGFGIMFSLHIQNKKIPRYDSEDSKKDKNSYQFLSIVFFIYLIFIEIEGHFYEWNRTRKRNKVQSKMKLQDEVFMNLVIYLFLSSMQVYETEGARKLTFELSRSTEERERERR